MLPVLCQRRCVLNDKDWIIFLIGWTKFWVGPLGIWLKSLWYSPKCVHMTRCERARGLQVLFCILKSTPTAPAVVTWKRFQGCVWKPTQWVMTEEVRNVAEQQVHVPPLCHRQLVQVGRLPQLIHYRCIWKGIVCQGIFPRRLRLLLGHRGGYERSVLPLTELLLEKINRNERLPNLQMRRGRDISIHRPWIRVGLHKIGRVFAVASASLDTLRSNPTVFKTFLDDILHY